MFKRLFLTALFTGVFAGVASATPITGSFSLVSFSGSYIGNAAAAATGLDFGPAFGKTGNGFGINGTAIVGNTTGSFVGLDGSLASIADISLDVFANPFTVNPFVSFINSSLVLNFSDALFTRSPLGTSVTITGAATFTDGNPVDTSIGMFSLATSSQNGSSSGVDFTFTSNASVSTVTSVPILAVVTDVPEPASLALLGTGMIGLGLFRRKRT